MKRRGMTLVELLITMVLLGTLTTSMFWLLAVAKAQWLQGTSRAGLRQELQRILGGLDAEMRNSEGDLITDSTDSAQNAFSFPSAVDAKGRFTTDDSGGAVWQRWVVIYVPSGTTRLLRRDIYVTFPDPAVALTPEELAAYCNGSGRLLSASTQDVTVNVDPDTGLATLALTVSGTSGNGKVDRLTASVSIVTRN